MTYPPPTLASGTPARTVWIRRVVLLGTLFLLAAIWAVSNLLPPRPAELPDKVVKTESAVRTMEAGSADVVLDLSSENVATPAPAPSQVKEPAISEPSGRWYHVAKLGDGPAAIFGRGDGQWDYALACNAALRTIEFVAVRTGDPQGFDGQYLGADGVRTKLDATYAKDSGGTIAMTLPAGDGLFDAVAGGKALEAQVVASGPVRLAADADVARLIRQCRA